MLECQLIAFGHDIGYSYGTLNIKCENPKTHIFFYY